VEQNFVLDNSVIISWCFKNEANKYSDIVLDSLEYSVAAVPSIWLLEVVNVLLVAERRKRLSEADSTRFIELLNQLPIVVEHDLYENKMGDFMSMGRKYNLSSYDASYIELAMRSGLPLATLDKSLRSACKKAKVPVYKK
jgi:predicted nucleic acid-binding protein